MDSNIKKILIFSVGFGAALAALLLAYSRHQTAGFESWRRSGGAATSSPPPASPSGGHGSLLSSDGDIKALVARNARRGRSPAFVPGSLIDKKVRASVERLLVEPRVAATNERLRAFFPDSAPTGFWIRASLALASVPSEGELSPENFEAIGNIYAKILAGDESSIASLEAGLKTLPSEEASVRRQAFRILSDIGLHNPELRDPVKNVLFAEAVRAGGHPEGALAFTSLLRINPTKEWYREVSHAYERLHPGSELSDFVSLNVANL